MRSFKSSDVKNTTLASEIKESGNAIFSKKSSESKKQKLFNIKVDEELFKSWKSFCSSHDLTLTETVKKAMKHLISDVEKNKIELL